LRLINLKIKNFRSFGNEDTEITFGDRVNLLVGENNVGKSTILKCLDLLKGDYGLAPNDYHKGEGGREVLIQARIKLNDTEVSRFFQPFLRTYRGDKEATKKILSGFGTEVIYSYSSKWGFYLRFGKFHISGESGQMVSDLGTVGGRHWFEWEDVLKSFLEQTSYSLLEIIKKNLTDVRPKGGIRFNFNSTDNFQGLLKQKAKKFSETRESPKGTGEHVLESYEGRQVADVLFTLKNGSPTQRKRFRNVQRKFNELFRNLKLEVVKESKDSPPRIVIEKTSIEYEVPIEFVGAGIGEIILFLTHLIASKDMIFGLDMPELHFHPHAQRLLHNIIREQSEKNQFLIITHSPTFIESRQTENTIVVRETNGETTVSQLPPKYFNEDERLRLFRQLDTASKDFFFSRRVLVVEGPTEGGAMPIFSKALNRDFDENGVSVVESGKFFGIFLKLLKGFSFSYQVMCDKDALMNIEKSINVGKKEIKTSPVFYSLWTANSLSKSKKKRLVEIEPEIELQSPRKEIYPDVLFKELQEMASKYDVYVLPSDFEGIFKRDGYASIMQRAKSLSKSKVIRGRYVAEQIVEKDDTIPKEFCEVVERITEK